MIRTLIICLVLFLLAACGPAYPIPDTSPSDGALTAVHISFFELADHPPESISPRLRVENGSFSLERQEEKELSAEDIESGILEQWCFGFSYIVEDPGRNIRFSEKVVYRATRVGEDTWETWESWEVENLYTYWGFLKDHNSDYDAVWIKCLQIYQ